MTTASSDTRYSLEALAGFLIGNMTIFSSPLYIGALMDGLGADESQAGLVCSLEIGAVAVSCVLFSGRLDKLPLRRIGVTGVCLAAISNLLSLSQDTLGYLTLLRIFCGIGSGMCLAASSAVISRAFDPDRVAGIVVALNTILMAVVIAAIGYTKQHFLFDGVMGIYLLVLALAFIPLLMLPGEATDTHTDAPSAGQIDSRNIFQVGVFGVGLLFIYCVVEGSIWSFSERSGVNLGLTGSRIGMLLATASIAGLCGAAVSAVAGKRIRRDIPLAAGSVMMGIAGYLVYNTGQQWIYELSVLGFTFAFFLGFPYLIGGCAMLDREGRWAARANGINLIGAATAPFLAGNIIVASGYAELGWFIIALGFICAAGGLMFAARLQRLSHPDPETSVW